MRNSERANTVYCNGTGTHYIYCSDSTGSGGGSFPDNGSQHSDGIILAVAEENTGDMFLANPETWRTRTEK